MREYNAENIKVLKGLEPVRLRPGMYIGSTNSDGLHHLAWEIIDNCVDEAINGHCNTITVKLLPDNFIEITDNGRGIPVDIYDDSGKTALEVIFTTLHAGGKFDDSNYNVSGGLHGVGSSVVCALAESIEVTSYKNSTKWRQHFSKGVPVSEIENLGATSKRGTRVKFKADSTIFPDIKFNLNKISDFLKTKAFLNAGLKIIIQSGEERFEFHYPEGIHDYINQLIKEKNKLPLNENLFFFSNDAEFKLEAAIYWLSGCESSIFSFANSIKTIDGGSHENGLKSGVAKAVRSYLESHNLVPKNIVIANEDTRNCMLGIVSVFLKGHVEFQGQTKNRLNSDITVAVENKVRSELENYLNHNVGIGKKIADHVITAAKARIAAREAKSSVLRKKLTSQKINLPGKLSDCTSNKFEESELFICEGDSAGGSSKMARNRFTQAILPIRGKILNVEGVALSKIDSNQEIQNITSAIGCGIGNGFDISRLRYGKVIIMTDADADGAHISILLLTFFFRYMTPLVEHGHLYIALPPLFRIDNKNVTYYAGDEKEKDKLMKKLKGNIEVGRFKGLGEMPSEDLKITTMAPETRRILKVSVNDMSSSDELFQKLMGNDASRRYDFISEHAVFAKEKLDI
ncbi:MAG: type IIA DNA topoisomerase subunit B [Nitrospinae bacterium]|nr:type IIA DNA topoisomerase subunit B [Nitrospinota bacterium]